MIQTLKARILFLLNNDEVGYFPSSASFMISSGVFESMS